MPAANASHGASGMRRRRSATSDRYATVIVAWYSRGTPLAVANARKSSVKCVTADSQAVAAHVEPRHADVVAVVERVVAERAGAERVDERVVRRPMSATVAATRRHDRTRP